MSRDTDAEIEAKIIERFRDMRDKKVVGTKMSISRFWTMPDPMMPGGKITVDLMLTLEQDSPSS